MAKNKIEYANYNKYGYRVLTLVIDAENKHLILYHGQTAPISKPDKKTSKKFIREQFELLSNSGYTTETH